MNAVREKGEGRFGLVVGILVLLLGGFMIFNAAPVYFAHWALLDEMDNAALGPPNRAYDEVAHNKVWAAVEELSLDEYVAWDDIVIRTGAGKRRISVSYQREVQFLPGFKRMMDFDSEISQPVF